MQIWNAGARLRAPRLFPKYSAATAIPVRPVHERVRTRANIGAGEWSHTSRLRPNRARVRNARSPMTGRQIGRDPTSRQFPQGSNHLCGVQSLPRIRGRGSDHPRLKASGRSSTARPIWGADPQTPACCGSGATSTTPARRASTSDPESAVSIDIAVVGWPHDLLNHVSENWSIWQQHEAAGTFRRLGVGCRRIAPEPARPAVLPPTGRAGTTFRHKNALQHLVLEGVLEGSALPEVDHALVTGVERGHQLDDLGAVR